MKAEAQCGAKRENRASVSCPAGLGCRISPLLGDHMRPVAYISFHTSPLDLPGEGDAGGLNTYLRNLVSHMAKLGFHCDVFTRQVSPSQPEVTWVDAGVRVICLPAGPARPLEKDELVAHVEDFVEALVPRLKSGGHCLLHSHYWLSGLAALAASKVTALPVVHTAHTWARLRALPDGGESRLNAENVLARSADLVVVSTDHEEKAIVESCNLLPEQVRVISPGVDHERFLLPSASKRVQARAEIGAGPDDLVVVCVGRVQRLKGTDLAVKAVQMLSRQMPSVASRIILAVVGGASGADGRQMMEHIRLLAVSAEMRARVVFLPPRSHVDLVEIYHAADVCLAPARSESFGLVALEAQACGVPVVAAAIDGLVCAVRDGESGLLVARPDPNLFAVALGRLLSDDELRTRLSRGAREASRAYSWELVAKQHCREYDVLLELDGIAACG